MPRSDKISHTQAYVRGSRRVPQKVSPGPVADVEARRGSESTSLPPRQRRRALIANWPDKPNAASPPRYRPFDERQLSVMRDYILERKKSDKHCDQKRRYRDFLRI